MRTWTSAIFALVSNIVFVLPFSGQELAKDTGSQTVVAEGVGASPDEALKDAFRNCVRQVVGAIIDAETLVKNDELINDNVLTYSDGFIKKFDEIDGSKKQNGGLHRVRIKAEVERKSLIAKLRSSNVVMKSVDGNGLFAQTVTKLDSEKDAIAILEKQFKGFPQSCLTASVVGEPKVIEKDSLNATIEIMVQLEPNMNAFRDFSKSLRSILDKMTKEKGEFEVTCKPNTGFAYTFAMWNLHNPPPPSVSDFATASDGSWYSVIASNNWFPSKFGKTTKPQAEEKKVVLSIGTNRSKPGERIDFASYRLDSSLSQSLNDVVNRKGIFSVALLDGSGEQITVKEMKLHQPLLLQIGAYKNHAQCFYLCPTFFPTIQPEAILGHTPVMKVPFRFKLSLEELKTLTDIKVEVQFED
jgi:hypothetical protein